MPTGVGGNQAFTTERVTEGTSLPVGANLANSFIGVEIQGDTTPYKIDISSLSGRLNITQTVLGVIKPKGKGAYSAGTQYTLMDYVDSGNQHYLYIGDTPSTGTPLTDTTKWTPLLTDGTNGTNGTNGVNAYTTTSAAFTVPAINSAVTISVVNSAWMVSGQTIFIATAGLYTIASIASTTSISATNTGASGNASAAATIASGSAVSPGGRNGTNGTNGTSAIATTSSFTQPAINANVTVTVSSSAGFVDKQPLFHDLGGYYIVSGSPPSATTVTLKNLGYAGNIAAAASVGAGTLVPSGLKGLDASGSGHVIEVNGTALTQRGKLNIVATGATYSDDAAGDRTVVNLPSGGSGSTTTQGVALRATVAQPIASGSIVALNFPAPTSDPLGIYSALQPSRVTAPFAGWYQVEAFVTVATSLAINDFSVFLRKNGTTSTPQNRTPNPTGGANPGRSVSALVYLTAGDYYELCVYQDSGSNLNTSILNDQNATLTIASTASSSAGGFALRELLTAARTYYVRTDGNDTNNGLTDNAAGAFLTLDRAILAVASLDLGVISPKIKLADGTYSGSTLFRTLIGAGKVLIEGNLTTPANVILTTTTGDVLYSSSGFVGVYQLKGVTINAPNNAIYINGGGFLEFGKCVLGTCGSVQLATQNGSKISIIDNYSITGDAVYHVYAIGSGAAIFYNAAPVNPVTVTFVGSRNFSAAFGIASALGLLEFDGPSYCAFGGSVASATGLRYICNENALIKVGGAGATYLPGSTNGSPATGGQYN